MSSTTSKIAILDMLAEIASVNTDLERINQIIDFYFNTSYPTLPKEATIRAVTAQLGFLLLPDRVDKPKQQCLLDDLCELLMDMFEDSILDSCTDQEEEEEEIEEETLSNLLRTITPFYVLAEYGDSWIPRVDKLDHLLDQLYDWQPPRNQTKLLKVVLNQMTQLNATPEQEFTLFPKMLTQFDLKAEYLRHISYTVHEMMADVSILPLLNEKVLLPACFRFMQAYAGMLIECLASILQFH